MTRAFIIAALLSAAGCAGTGGTSDLASTPAAAAVATPPANVLEVKASSLTDDTTCRTEKPTGTQIAVRRCRSGDTDANQDSQATTLRDIEEMRARQNLQQTREIQNALNAAQQRPRF